jgi:hypothetical protein
MTIESGGNGCQADLHHVIPPRIELALQCASSKCSTRIVQRSTPSMMARVAQSSIVALQRFAKGLADDYDAIKAGLTLPRSTGPVEGYITRLKLLKRQMFGRASLVLLQRRFVLGPRRVQGGVQRPQALSEAQAQPAAA